VEASFTEPGIGRSGGHKRTRLEILLEILRETEKPTKKTHLLYKARINHDQLSRYLQILLDLKMIERTVKPLDGYLIADKGKILLRLFETKNAEG
jgi:predicted transcriptional regulator